MEKSTLAWTAIAKTTTLSCFLTLYTDPMRTTTTEFVAKVGTGQPAGA